MNIYKVTNIKPLKTGAELVKMVIEVLDNNQELVDKYEIWSEYDYIQEYLFLERFPQKGDLEIFAEAKLSELLEQYNYTLPNKGIFISNKGYKFDLPQNLPKSLNVDTELIQTNISLPSSLHDWAKMYCVKNKISLSELIRTSLIEQKQKSIVKDAYQELFDINEKLRQLVDKETRYERDAKDIKGLFLSFSLAKAYKSHASIVNLCKLGFGEDGAIISRSILELAIMVSYIMKDKTNSKLKRYLDYDWILRKKMFDYIKTKPKLRKMIEQKEKELSVNQDSIKVIEKKAQDVMNKHKYKDHTWSKKSIRGMSTEVGREDAYSTIYALQCNFSHTSPRVMNEYIKAGLKGVIIDNSRSMNWVHEVLVTAFDGLYSIFDQYSKYYKAANNKELKSLVERYSNSPDTFNNIN